MPRSKKAAAEKVASAAKQSAQKGNKAPTANERMASLKEYVEKKLKGRAILKPASEYVLPYLTKRLPTGLLTLDLVLKGGFPAGGLSQIVGAKNAGKSWVTWQVIRQLQHFLGDKMRVLLVMTEMRADRSQGRLAGVEISLGDEDIEAMRKARKENGWPDFTPEEIARYKHQIGQIDELHGEDAEILYDVVLKAVEDNVYHLIIIDSFGSIISGAEAETESLSEKTYGGSSGVNTQFLKKLGALMNLDDKYGKVRDVCILGINQIRDNIKDPNKEYKTTGGKMLEHFKFVDIFLRGGKLLGANEYLPGPNGPVQTFVAWGKEVTWKIEKGKAGIHEGEQGRFNFVYDIGTADFFNDTIVAGIKMGVVVLEGSYYGIPNPDQEGAYLMRTQGRDKFIEALDQDAKAKALAGDSEASFMNYIRDQCFRKAEINISYDWE